MMNGRWKFPVPIAVAVWLLCASTASADSFTFSFSPLPADGAITGEAGATIGWGYTITNESDSWLEIFGLTADAFSFAVPDSSIFDFPILAPGASHTVAYDAATFAGLYQLTWDAIAPAGLTNAGLFVMSGQFYDGDPFDAGNPLNVSFDRSAGYSATVAAPVPVPVPEPGTLVLLGTGAAALLMRRRKVRRA
jgi:hypothetical protein